MPAPTIKPLHTPGSALNRRVRSIGVVNLFTYRKFVILYLDGHSGNRGRIRATGKTSTRTSAPHVPHFTATARGRISMCRGLLAGLVRLSGEWWPVGAGGEYAHGVVLGGRPRDDRRMTAEELRLCLRAARMALQVSTTGGFHPPGSTPRP